ncbi:MAG: DUF2335 domain-containing protein [Synergistaceae bacterium]|jgi:uncharacterized membrane protein|nr:DUF2335 domain-containing protein [Synergistaceae bacterium]
MSRKAKKKLPASKTPQSITAARQVAVSYFGPIPPASEMMKYEDACPGLTDRIMKMAERQSSHRQEIERIAIAASSRNSTLGVVFAFILAMATLGVGAFCIYLGKDILGTSISGVGLAAIVGAFIYGTRSNRAERETKHKLSNAP